MCSIPEQIQCHFKLVYSQIIYTNLFVTLTTSCRKELGCSRAESHCAMTLNAQSPGGTWRVSDQLCMQDAALLTSERPASQKEHKELWRAKSRNPAHNSSLTILFSCTVQRCLLCFRTHLLEQSCCVLFVMDVVTATAFLTVLSLISSPFFFLVLQERGQKGRDNYNSHGWWLSHPLGVGRCGLKSWCTEYFRQKN